MIIGLTFAGCNPLDDIYSDIDAQPNPVVAAVDYTLTSEDYEIYEDQLDGEEYFENQDQADLLIPDLLGDKFPVYGEGSLINVGYNLFDETTLEPISTTETLSNLDGIDNYLSSNFETATDGTFVELTYNAEVLSYTLSNSDFETIEGLLGSKYPDATSSAANFGNFERRSSRDSYWSDDMILEALTSILASEYNTGQVVVITFAIFDGSPGSESFTVQHNGYNFLKLDVEASGVDAIEYTLSADDYDTIAADLAATYPNPASNLAQFGSFDVRFGSSNNAWSTAMLIEGFNIILPVATEGDIYLVSFAAFNGSGVVTQSLLLLYQGGEYVENEAVTVEVSAVVAKNNGDWEFPYTFTRTDYDSFGFRFPNFGSSDLYILDIFLEDLFPFAQAGDVATVQYDFFAGGTSTKYGQSIFDGDNWKLTPDVIETSFQYGFEDGEWLPDNTINYMLLSADIDLISNTFINTPGFEGPADNVGFFGSFDRRSGSGNFWSDEMLLEAFNVLLDTRDPSAAEGQKYALTFVVFTGSTGNETKNVIKTDGVWVYNE